MTGKLFTAELDGDDLVFTLAAGAVGPVRTAVELLADHLEDKWINHWSPQRRVVRKDLFPPAYRSRAAQEEYEQRHGAAMKADLLAAARRVLDALAGSRPMRCPAAASDDWIRVLGVARLLYTHRQTPLSNNTQRARMANLLTAMQHEVLVVLRPELNEVGQR